MSKAVPTSREIRVFLSSTFRDMEAERNHLVKQIFPKVRAACLARQVGFTEIDLRWGVTEDESKNGATVEICLKEIDRCREFPPFFIGFLGERYGWMPKHEELAAYWQKRRNSSYARPIQQAIKRGISVTELEMELGVLEEDAADRIASHALFLLRGRTLTDQLYCQDTGNPPNPQDTAYYDPAFGKLLALKDRIRSTPFLGIDGYTTIEQFGKVIETYLLGQLDLHFSSDGIPSPQERQLQSHAALRYQRLQNFLPRDDVRKHIIKLLKKRLDAPHLGPVLLTGPSGQGKSALMADLARHLEITHPEWIVIDHYIGADDTNSLDSWARRILQSLHKRIHDLVDAIPKIPKGQKEALSTWIAMACRRQEQNTGKEAGSVRLILILDALDQCNDRGKDLELLRPEILGPDAIVVVSAADGTPARDAASEYETLVVPPLTAKLKARMIHGTLARYRKKLTPELAERLVATPESGSPLFLSLALEKLRLDASHESLADLVDDILNAQDAEELFLNNFLLDVDYGRPELPTLAAACMALLGASHAGLSENELADLLALPTDPKAKDTKKPRLPQIHLSRLLANMQPFLLNKGGRRAPMHRIFGESALQHYGTTPVRKHLYRHFKSGYGKGKAAFDARAATETLYQITQLAKTEAKARQYLVADLGVLHVPVKLQDDELSEKIVLDAITTLTDKETSALARRWAANIRSSINTSTNAERYGYAVAKFGKWLDQITSYFLARTLLETLLEKQEQLLSPDHQRVADSLHYLGNVFYKLGDFGAAHARFRQALIIRRKALGESHPDTLATLNDFAVVLNHQGHSTAAGLFYQQVLQIRERVLGPNHPDTAESLNNVATLLSEEAALPLFVRSLAIREATLGPNHADTLNSLHNLASTLDLLGRKDEARRLMERALIASEKSYGPNHLSTGTCLDYLAVFLWSNGNSKEAEPLCRRALAIMERGLGQIHPSIATTLNSLAFARRLNGDSVEAEMLYRRALAISEKALGAEHPETATALANLASLLESIDDYTGAESLYRRVLAIREISLGTEHLDTAKSLVELASLLQTIDDDFGAEPLYRRAVAIREKALGVNHPDTVDCLTDLIVVILNSNSHASDELLYKRALGANEMLHGQESSEVGIVLQAYAVFLRQLGKLDESKNLLLRALSLYEKVVGEDGKDTLDCLDNLADLFESKGEIDTFVKMRRQQLSRLERSVGGSHEETLRVMQNFAVSLRNAGRLDESEPLQREAMARFICVHGEASLEAANAYSAMGSLLKLKNEFIEAESYYRKALAIRERELEPDDEATVLVRTRLDALLEQMAAS